MTDSDSVHKKPRMHDYNEIVEDCDVEPVKIVSYFKFLWILLEIVTKLFSSCFFQVLKWNNCIFHLEVDPLDDVAILRYEIFKQTQVKAERQKILNLKGKAGEQKALDSKSFGG